MAFDVRADIEAERKKNKRFDVRADIEAERDAGQKRIAESRPTETKAALPRIAPMPKIAEEREVTTEKAGFGEWLAKNAAAGLSAFNKGIGSTIDFIVPDMLSFGIDKKINEYYSKEDERISEAAREVSKSRGKGYEIGGEVINATVAALPNAITALMSGGMSAAPQLAGGTTQATSTIAEIAQKMMKNPSFWTSFMRSAGNNYEEAKADGASDSEAAVSSMLSSFLESGIEVGGGIEKLPEVVKGNKQLFRNWVKSSFEEGGEEVLQGIVNGSVAKLFYDQEREMFSIKDEKAVINPKVLAKEAAIGTAVGGILGGGQTAFSMGLNTLNSAAINKKASAENSGGNVIQYTAEEADGIRKDSQTFRNVIADTDITLGEFFNKWKLGRKKGEKLEKLYLGKASESVKQQISELLGYEIPNRDFILTNEAVKHIFDEHGDVQKEESRGQVVIDEQTILSLRETLNNPDSITKEFRKKEPRIVFKKKTSAGNVIAVEFDNKGRATLSLKTIYIKKDQESTQRGDFPGETRANLLTSETTVPNSLDNTNIPQESGIVKDAVISESPGFTKTEFSDKITNKQIRALDSIGRALGVNISIGAPTGNAPGAYNGYYENGNIVIAQDAKNPLEVVLCHEVTHHMKRTAPAEYNAFLELAINASEKLSNTEKSELISRYKTAYSEGTQTEFSDTQALDEIAGDFTKNIVHDISLFDRLVQDNRTIAMRLLDSIKEFITKVKSTFSGDKTKADTAAQDKYGAKVSELETATAQWEKMLTATEAAVASGNINTAGTNAGGEVQYDLKIFEDGKRFVDVQTDQHLFDGLTENEKGRMATQIIKERFSGKVVGRDNRVFVNGRSAAEYGHPAKRISGLEYDAKMRASTELDNLIDAGTNFRTAPDGADGHVHPQATGDFKYFDTIFKVGNEYFEGRINILPNEKGDLLTDITQIKNITQDISSSYGQNPKSTFLRDNSEVSSTSTNSISKTPPNVNRENSLKTEDLLSPDYGKAAETQRSDTDENSGDGSYFDETGLTDGERGAVLDYKGGGSYNLNAKFRAGVELNEYEAEMVKNLDSALVKLPKYRGKVYRNISLDYLSEVEYNQFVENHIEGEFVFYDGYTSTSTDIDGYPIEGERVVHFEIESVTGADLDSYGNNFEKEILIPRNAQFYVESVKIGADGYPLIIMREIADYEQTDTGRGKGAERNGTDMPRGDGTGSSPSSEASEVQQVREKNEMDVRAVSKRHSSRSSDTKNSLQGVSAEGVSTTQRNNNEEATDAKDASAVSSAVSEKKGKNPKSGSKKTKDGMKISKVRTNSIQKSGIFSEEELSKPELAEEKFKYKPVGEDETLRRARERIAEGKDEAREYIENKEAWDGADTDTAFELLRMERADAAESGDWVRVGELARLIRKRATKAGQEIQAHAKYTRTAEKTIVEAAEQIENSSLVSKEDLGILRKLIKQFVNDKGELDVARMNKALTTLLEEEPKIRQKRVKKVFEEIIHSKKKDMGKMGFLMETEKILSSHMEDTVKAQSIMKTVSGAADLIYSINEDSGASKEKLIALIKRQAAIRGHKISKANEKRLLGEDFEFLYETAEKQLRAITEDYIPRSLGQKVSTIQSLVQLLQVPTYLTNIISNRAFGFVDKQTANAFGQVFDRIIGFATKQKTVGYEHTIRHGISKAGEKQKNRAKINAALDIKSGEAGRYGTGTTRTFKSDESRWRVTKFLSNIEKLLAYELNVPDEAQKGRIKHAVADSLIPLVKSGNMTVEEATEIAADEARYRTFQDDNLPSLILGDIKKVANRVRIPGMKDFGAGDFICKYTQVAGALIERTLEYSPAGYIKGVYNLGEMMVNGISAKKQREAALAFARGTTGTGLIILGTLLSSLGIVFRDDDESDDNIRALNSAEGVVGTKINLSAMGRLLAGKSAEAQKGDILIAVDRFEPFNMFLTAGAEIAKAENKSLCNIALTSISGATKSIRELSVMQTIDEFFSLFEYSDNEDQLTVVSELAIFVGESTIGSFIPSAVRRGARAFDNNYRDAYADDSELKTALRQLGSSIPGVRNTLPKKLDNFGHTKTYTDNLALNVGNALIAPFEVSRYKKSDVSRELDRVRKETGSVSIYPPKSAPYSIKYDGEKYVLHAEARERYQKMRGNTYYRLIFEALKNERYKKLNAEQQASVLEDFKKYATDKAKDEYFKSVRVEYKRDSAAYDADEERLEGVKISDYYIDKYAADEEEKAKSEAREKARRTKIEEQFGKMSDETYNKVKRAISKADDKEDAIERLQKLGYEDYEARWMRTLYYDTE